MQERKGEKEKKKNLVGGENIKIISLTKKEKKEKKKNLEGGQV